MKAFTVTGAHGSLKVCAETGRVLEVDYNKYADCQYCRIGGYTDTVKADIGEWYRARPNEEQLEGRTIDILNFGLWYKNGGYIGPVEKWREHHRVRE